MNGFVLVDKPKGPTSFDIIRTAQRALGQKKIGHNGTLDPDASGLLILAVGTATRLLPFLPAEPKQYSFTVQFGTTTDTLDGTGTVVDHGKQFPSAQVLSDVIPSFAGTLLQKPPRFSAVKIRGRRAYKLARANQEIDIPKREITIHELSLLHYDENSGQASFTTRCSGGTYIRALARDIAAEAGTIGYASAIRRTAVGRFSVDMAVPVEAIQKDPDNYLHPVGDMITQYPSYTASPKQIQAIRYGHDIEPVDVPGDTTLFVYNQEQELIAVARQVAAQRYHPIKVFIQP